MTYDSTGADIYGAFRLILFDSTVEDYCVVNWVFDDTTVAPDTDYADGYVTDGFYGADLEVWFGYVVFWHNHKHRVPAIVSPQTG